jgi:hypothetical protein
MNYPRIWLLPEAVGLGQQASTAIGIALGILFLASVLLLVGPVSTLEALVYIVALGSPAILLAIERGNNDLCIFALLVAGMWLRGRVSRFGRLAGAGLFLLAAISKLYPVFAVGLLALRERLAVIVLGVFLLYAALTASDLYLISNATPRALVLAYGLRPAASVLGIPAWLIGAATFVGVGVAAWVATGIHAPVPAASILHEAFEVGAVTYAGTFFLGSDYVYRLVFLLMTVPQLLLWTRSTRSIARVAAIVGTVIELAVLWTARFTAGPGLGMQAFQLLSVILLIALSGVAIAMALPGSGLGRLITGRGSPAHERSPSGTPPGSLPDLTASE